MKQKFKIVLLGSDDNVYGMSRSCFEKYKTTTIALGLGHLAPTRFTNIVEVIQVKDFNKEKIFIKSIVEKGKELKKTYEKLILVPCLDYYMELCIKNRDKLKGIYENNFISNELLQKFITKDKFYELCEKFDIKYPKTIICKYKDRKNIHKKINFKYPIILKPNNSLSSEYLYCDFPNKKKVFYINNEDELKSIIKDINSSTYKDNLIIQEYIKGDDSCNRVINCYSDKKGKVQMMALGRAVLEEYAPGALGNYAAIISDPGYHKIFDKIKIMLEGLGYTGFSNFDIKYDKERNEYYFFELNYRQGRSSFFVNAAGISLAGLFVDDLVYNKSNKNVKYPTKKILWLNVPDSVAKKYITDKDVLIEVKNLIHSKNVIHTLFYENDLSMKRLVKMRKIYTAKKLQYKKYFIKKDDMF